jgi:hypothetical protein
MFEAAYIGRQVIEGFFAGVPEWWVSQIVCKAYRLGQGDIEADRFGDCPSNLGDLYAVCKAGAVVVVEAGREDLRFTFEPAEG